MFLQKVVMNLVARVVRMSDRRCVPSDEAPRRMSSQARRRRKTGDQTPQGELACVVLFLYWC
jgi:hypothetical protein